MRGCLCFSGRSAVTEEMIQKEMKKEALRKHFSWKNEIYRYRIHIKKRDRFNFY